MSAVSLLPALLLIALKSVILAAITLGLLRFAARRSAAVRSAIAHLGICALLVAPLVSALLPPLAVILPQRLSVEVLQTSAPVMMKPLSVLLAPDLTPTTVVAQARGAGAFILCAYLVPAASLLLLMGAALIQLFRLRLNARPVTDAAWHAAFTRAQRRMGFTHSAMLLTGGAITSPISWGLIRPTILLNEEVLAAGAQAEAVLAHELAHVIQHDWAKLILSRVTTALFWFNPLAWLLACEAHQLREEAADDAVLAAGIGGADYAALLIDVARNEALGSLSAVHAMAPRRSALYRRITRVLDDGAARSVPGRSQVAALTAAALTVALPLAALKLAPAVAPVAGVLQAATHGVVAAATPLTPVRAPDVAAPVRTPAQPAVKPSGPDKKPVTARPAPAAAPAAPAPPAALQQHAGLNQYPQMLRAELDTECFRNGGSPGSSPNLFQTADFNNDGIPDIVFDRTNYECRDATVGPGRYGTTLTIFVGGPSHSVAEVYTGSFYGSWVEYGGDGKASLIVADAANCAAGDTSADWESCAHRIVLAAPAQYGGPEPAADKAEDR